MPMSKEDIRQVRLGQIDDIVDWDYMDGDIAFYENIKEMPIRDDGSVQIDMSVMVMCRRGRMRIDINSVEYVIGQNDVILAIPNDKLDNCMLSPDFNGAILCLSDRIIMESLSQSDVWSRAFHFRASPVLHIDEDGVSTLESYANILRLKINHKTALFHKEIIFSLVRAIMYDVLSVISERTPSTGNMLITSREVLFKRFLELLASVRVKPRKVSWYADRLCVSSKYLSTVCGQVSGKTAFDWISDYVCMDIRHLLKNSNKSIKEITDSLNFPNMSFFGKYCRQHFGASPTELRRLLREQKETAASSFAPCVTR